MKIAIISDIHGNDAYLAKAKAIIDAEKLEIVICCGDIQDEECFKELDSWKQKVYIALGNADYKIRESLHRGTLYAEHAEVVLEYGILNIGGAKIAYCHYDHSAKKLAESGKFDIVFYGHTHTPWEEKIGKTVLLNPGEITAQFGKPTFAIYDLAGMKGELKILV